MDQCYPSLAGGRVALDVGKFGGRLARWIEFGCRGLLYSWLWNFLAMLVGDFCSMVVDFFGGKFDGWSCAYSGALLMSTSKVIISSLSTS